MALLNALACALLMGAAVLAQSPTKGWDARRPPRESERGIFQSAPTAKNFRQGAEPSGTAHSCIARRGARDATVRMPSTARPLF